MFGFFASELLGLPPRSRLDDLNIVLVDSMGELCKPWGQMLFL
jgi:hypothetical protein